VDKNSKAGHIAAETTDIMMQFSW